MLSLHSHHGPSADAATPFAEPEGYTVRHLNAQLETLHKIQDQYELDKTPFHKVDLQRTYSVATKSDKDVARLDQEAIRPWIGTLIFPISVNTFILLYVPAAVSVLVWAHPSSKIMDKQLCRTLVPWIPVGVQAQLTCLQPIVDPQESRGEMQRDLRWDLLQMTHSFSTHTYLSSILSTLSEI